MAGCSASYAQTVVFQRKTEDYIPKNTHWGRNKANFVAPNLEMSWALGPQAAGAELLRLPSYNFRVGIMYKRKINRWFSLGPLVQYSAERLVLRQHPGKLLPDNDLHSQEWFNLQGLATGIFLRFNYDVRRGNIYGFFSEIGISHVLIPKFTHVIRESVPNGPVTEVRTHNNPYTLPGYGEIFLKMGFYHVNIVARYRFTPLFKKEYQYPNPSPVKLGLELCF